MTMTKREEWIGEGFVPYVANHYRMATTAQHLLGDISRDSPNLCLVRGETADHYIGAWETGLGFVDVKFPKETTRKLTPAEAEHFRTRRLVIAGAVCAPYEFDADDVAEEATDEGTI